MALKISKVQFWSGRIEDRPGGGAAALSPLAKAKVDLKFVLARRTPETPGKGVIFVTPIAGAKAEQAARAAGLAPSTDVVGLRVEGSNVAGTGHALTDVVARSGVSFRGISAAVVGRSFVCYFALDSEADADKAAAAIKKIKGA